MRRYYIFIMILAVVMLSACSLKYLPKGEFLHSHDSPDKQYTVNIYLANGGATVDYAIRGELVDNNTGKAKNIYWNYHEDEAKVSWKDNDTVVINKHVLDVPDDTYDFRDYL